MKREYFCSICRIFLTWFHAKNKNKKNKKNKTNKKNNKASLGTLSGTRVQRDVVF